MNKSRLIQKSTLAAALGTALAFALSTKAPAPGPGWESRQVSRFFWAEGVAVADVNQDGHPDLLSGPYWYAGPDFSENHLIYPAEKSFTTKDADGKEVTHPGFAGGLGSVNEYSNNFLSFAHDINADGFPDYLVVGFPGKETFWFENPGKNEDQTWQKHLALDVTDNESPLLADVNGDGRPDLIAMSKGRIGYASYDPAKPTAAWTWHAITPENPEAYQRYTHGLGYGDINGDGRTDLLERAGWWEQPADWDGQSPWKRHDYDFGKGGAQMYGYDVNEDGRQDIITSLAAHEWGVAWFEQLADGDWKRHLLTHTPQEKGSTGIAFSQPHAVEIADLNGDGTLDIVTGKRFWAHGPKGDPEPGADPVLYAFLLKRDADGVRYEAELIHHRSGIGTNFTIADLNGDGQPDVATANKLGLHIHLQASEKR